MKKNYISISVSSNDLGKRIDSFISEKLSELSRSKVQMLINNGNLNFNNEKITQTSIKLKKLGTLLLFIPESKPSKIIAQNLKLNIIYEDDYLIVINKKAGMVVHPAAGNRNNTVVNALLHHCKENLSGIGGVKRPGVVHRLDKMTSGLLVFAKDDHTHNALSEQFKKKETVREYNLLAWNQTPKEQGIIEKRICRSKFNRKKMAITNQKNTGKTAITKYKLLKNYKINGKISISHIQCSLMTGRTHQIRVHMSYLGNPLIGDKKYSRNNYYTMLPENLKKITFNSFINHERQALHAGKLGFFHPKMHKNMLFESKLPLDIHDLLSILNKSSN